MKKEINFKNYCITKYAKDIPYKNAENLFDLAFNSAKLRFGGDMMKTGKLFMSLVHSFKIINNIQ